MDSLERVMELARRSATEEERKVKEERAAMEAERERMQKVFLKELSQFFEEDLWDSYIFPNSTVVELGKNNLVLEVNIKEIGKLGLEYRTNYQTGGLISPAIKITIRDLNGYWFINNRSESDLIIGRVLLKAKENYTERNRKAIEHWPVYRTDFERGEVSGWLMDEIRDYAPELSGEMKAAIEKGREVE